MKLSKVLHYIGSLICLDVLKVFFISDDKSRAIDVLLDGKP